MALLKVAGKVSWFGGPNDAGVDPDEDLAFIYNIEMAPHLFLPKQPDGTTGLARRLDPDVHYVACRWDYDETPKHMLLEHMAIVRAVKTGKTLRAYPADWGPHEDTDRVADLSPGLMEELGIKTDDEVEVIFPAEAPADYKPYERIALSSAHGKHVAGATGLVDEVYESRLVVERVADELRERGVAVVTFNDDTSTSQNQNLEAIVAFHNGQQRDLDVSIHFNAYHSTDKPMGTEVLHVSQAELAGDVASAIASCGFINRGAKKRTDLFFLNETEKPAILIEVCFVDSGADVEIYYSGFSYICRAIADVLGGIETTVRV